MSNVVLRLAFVVVMLVTVFATARTQESVKVFVEEVRIPITAKESSEHFDPTVDVNDRS